MSFCFWENKFLKVILFEIKSAASPATAGRLLLDSSELSRTDLRANFACIIVSVEIFDQSA